jgi:hypothetical protein
VQNSRPDDGPLEAHDRSARERLTFSSATSQSTFFWAGGACALDSVTALSVTKRALPR